MQTLGGVLAGMGIFGTLGVFLIGFLLFGIIPIWALFDCAASKRGGGTKALIIILLLLFWGLGSLIYSVFSTDSKVLRRLTIFSLCGLVLLAIFSVSLLTGGAVVGSRIAEKKNLAEQKQVIEEFKPDSIDVQSVNPFSAIHFIHGASFPSSASAAKFTIAGPEPESAFPINDRIRHLIHDDRDNRYYALTQHDFGVIDPATHNFSKIDIDPLLAGDFSWPKGLAFDSENSEIIILTSHVDSSFFVYSPKTGAWKKSSTIRIYDLIALTYSPEDKALYALEEKRGKMAIRKFNRQGAELGTINISPTIPVARGQSEYVQMAYSSGRIILVMPPVPSRQQNEINQEARIFVIDPTSGKLFVPNNKERVKPKG